MKKIFGSFGIALFSLVFFATLASAHVVVRPKEVPAGAFQTFTVGVPVEKDLPTTQVRLVIPSGLNYVTPNVKPGWNIEVVEEGEGENTNVKEIIWSGSSIPVGQRDEFLFSAQVPAEASILDWKAYQTYADGEVVAWDQNPEEIPAGDHSSNPYSETKIVNDLAQVPTETQTKGNLVNNLPIVLSLLAVVFSLFAVYRSGKKK